MADNPDDEMLEFAKEGKFGELKEAIEELEAHECDHIFAMVLDCLDTAGLPEATVLQGATIIRDDILRRFRESEECNFYEVTQFIAKLAIEGKKPKLLELFVNSREILEVQDINRLFSLSAVIAGIRDSLFEGNFEVLLNSPVYLEFGAEDDDFVADAMEEALGGGNQEKPNLKIAFKIYSACEANSKLMQNLLSSAATINRNYALLPIFLGALLGREKQLASTIRPTADPELVATKALLAEEWGIV